MTEREWSEWITRFITRVDRWVPDLRPVFAWYDIWIGAYWDRKTRRLFLFALPCFGFVFDWSATISEGNPINPKTEVEEAVIFKIRRRREVGRKKYGTSMERADLSRRAWLTHAQEEAMDLAIYLERIIRELPEDE